MKSLIRIVRRYIGMAFLISITILLLNFFLIIALLYYYKESSYSKYSIEQIASQFIQSNGSFALSDKGNSMLAEEYVFAMELNDKGDVIWESNLPSELPKHYSLFQIASLTRWYLKGYPVHVWKNDYGLFIAGKPKDSTWKQIAEFPQVLIRNSPAILSILLACNLGLILILCLFLGWRLFRSLRPIAQGIESMIHLKRSDLAEKGVVSELSRKINETSALLEKQNLYLSKRDTARTNWIAGVSHDIRTPLSMIMGYAQSLEEDTALSQEQKLQAARIKEQSLLIKSLIEDLNLTSKLEYDMQPLRIREFLPASLLRQTVAAFLNQDLPDSYEVQLSIAPEVEPSVMKGDVSLLSRAFTNLLRNSIRHNEGGCNVNITASLEEKDLCLIFMDDGKGIPVSVIDALNQDHNPDSGSSLKKQDCGKTDVLKDNPAVPIPHIMGLRIVKQIMAAHGGSFVIERITGSGSSVHLSLPLL